MRSRANAQESALDVRGSLKEDCEGSLRHITIVLLALIDHDNLQAESIASVTIGLVSVF